jgi:MFS family permease
MSLSGLFDNVWLCGLFFILGWWARYFRTPARRALLVDVSPSDSRSRVFGFLHALDIGGGIFSALLALFFLLFLHLPIGTIILLSAAPLLISSLLLFFIKRDTLYPIDQPNQGKSQSAEKAEAAQKRKLFLALLVSATFYGFSFYNAGFPVLSAAISHKSGYALGLIAYIVYLGISAISGYALGSRKLRPIRALWGLGYLPSALASLLIGASIFFHLPYLAFYIFVAGLGLGMGAVETFEPTATSFLVKSSNLSRGMGWLSVSRSLGQFISNLVMGIIFSFNQSLAYLYAFAASLVATIVLASADWAAGKTASKEKG